MWRSTYAVDRHIRVDRQRFIEPVAPLLLLRRIPLLERIKLMCLSGSSVARHSMARLAAFGRRPCCHTPPLPGPYTRRLPALPVSPRPRSRRALPCPGTLAARCHRPPLPSPHTTPCPRTLAAGASAPAPRSGPLRAPCRARETARASLSYERHFYSFLGPYINSCAAPDRQRARAALAPAGPGPRRCCQRGV